MAGHDRCRDLNAVIAIDAEITPLRKPKYWAGSRLVEGARRRGGYRFTGNARRLLLDVIELFERI